MGAFMCGFGQDLPVFQKLLWFLFVKVLLCFLSTIRYERPGNGKILHEEELQIRSVGITGTLLCQKEFSILSSSHYCKKRIASLLLVHFKSF